MQNLSLLSSLRVNTIMNAIQDPRLLPQQLLFNSRVPDVPAANDEIMARFNGVVQIADVVMDDARAPVYSNGRFQYETTAVPNLKVGIGMNQNTIEQLRRLSGGVGSEVDIELFRGWQLKAIGFAKLGVQQRMEQLKVAMLCDGLGFSYDRMGIKLSGITWGNYSDLKVTVGTGWDTAATATPVSDLQGVMLTASVRYGMKFDRVTMSTQAFRYMIATTEFQNKARTYLAPNVSYTNLTLTDIAQQRIIAQNVLGVTLELYDARYWTQDVTGAITSAPFLPITNVLLTNSAMDGNPGAFDFANGPVTEALVAQIGGNSSVVGGITGTFGPLGYVTLADHSLNPPGIIHWGVARGFPRKHILQSSAVLSVGAFSDAISTSLPFPQ